MFYSEELYIGCFELEKNTHKKMYSTVIFCWKCNLLFINCSAINISNEEFIMI